MQRQFAPGRNVNSMPRINRLSLFVALALAVPAQAALAQTIVHSDGFTSSTQALTGAQSVVKTGTGTWAFVADNTYTGGTTIREGTLQLGNNYSSTGSLTGDVVNHGTLNVQRGTDLTLGGAISGTGKLDVNMTSYFMVSRVLTLTGSNTYTGGTTINTGTLSIGNGTVNGSLKGDVVNNGTFAVNNTFGNALTLDGTISGTGTLHKTGAGTLTLTGKNTYSGATNLNGGVLEIGAAGGNTGELRTSSLNVSGSNSQLVFNRTDDTTFSAGIGGSQNALHIVKNGQGTLTFAAIYGATANQIASLQVNEGTVIANQSLVTDSLRGNGTLVVNSTGSIRGNSDASARIVVGKSGQLGLVGLSQTNPGEHASAITNNGRVTASNANVSGDISGSGLVTLSSLTTVTGNNTYTGGTNVQGVVTLGSSGALGTTGTIHLTNTLKFTAANTTDYSARLTMQNGRIDTNGQSVDFANGIGNQSNSSFGKLGAGTLTLGGDNTYRGATTVYAGTLAIGKGGTSGSLLSSNVVINSDAALVFNRSDDSTYVGRISGAGTLVKQGDGMLQITGNISGFTGKAEILDGELRLSGISSSAIRIAQDATLTGSGRVGALDVEGLLNAAAGIGSLAANSATFDGGSIFRWELADATGAAGVGYDLFKTTGAMTFNADAGNKTSIQLAFLGGADGKASNFDAGIDHSFVLMTADAGFKGLNLDAFDIDASGLRYDGGKGRWTVTNSGNVLNLNYIANIASGDVPEPATALLFLAGLAGIGIGAQRRRTGARKAA